MQQSKLSCDKKSDEKIEVKNMGITIYTTSVCPYCDMAKKYFKENNVKFKEINVSLNPKAAQEMVEKSGQMGVPVIDIDGQIIVGFNKPALERILKQRSG